MPRRVPNVIGSQGVGENIAEAHAEEWLLIEWPKGESEPTKYWISTLPLNTTRRAFTDAKYATRSRQLSEVSAKRRADLFRGRHFQDEIILMCVRWYLRYSLSYRDLEEMMTLALFTAGRRATHFIRRGDEIITLGEIPDHAAGSSKSCVLPGAQRADGLR